MIRRTRGRVVALFILAGAAWVAAAILALVSIWGLAAFAAVAGVALTVAAEQTRQQLIVDYMAAVLQAARQGETADR